MILRSHVLLPVNSPTFCTFKKMFQNINFVNNTTVYIISKKVNEHGLACNNCKL